MRNNKNQHLTGSRYRSAMDFLPAPPPEKVPLGSSKVKLNSMLGDQGVVLFPALL